MAFSTDRTGRLGPPYHFKLTSHFSQNRLTLHTCLGRQDQAFHGVGTGFVSHKAEIRSTIWRLKSSAPNDNDTLKLRSFQRRALAAACLSIFTSSISSATILHLAHNVIRF